MNRTYDDERAQEIAEETRNMVTSPGQLTELLGHSPRLESRGITTELIFSQLPGWSIPIAAVQQYSTLDDFYRAQAPHFLKRGEKYRIVAAYMGTGEEWEALIEDESILVRMAVAQAADDFRQSLLIRDPASEVRLQVARYGTDNVRHILMEAELDREEPARPVLDEIAIHAEDPQLLDLAMTRLWEMPPLLISFADNLEAFPVNFFASLAKHPDENVRMTAANKALSEGYPEIVQKVLQSELSEMNRELLQSFLEDQPEHEPSEKLSEDIPKEEPPLEMPQPDLSEVFPKEPLSDGDTIVNILIKGVDGQSKHTTLSLAEANDLLAKFDREVAEDAQTSRICVDFQLRTVIDGEVVTYNGQYDLGDGDGTLLNHMSKYNEFCTSTPEWQEYIVATYGAQAWEQESSAYDFVQTKLLPHLQHTVLEHQVSESIDQTILPRASVPVENAVTNRIIYDEGKSYRTVELTPEQVMQQGFRAAKLSEDGLYQIMQKGTQTYAVPVNLTDLRDFAERVYQLVEEFDSSIFPPYQTKDDCIENLMDHCKAGLSEDVTRPLLAAINLSDSRRIKQRAAGLVLAYQKQQQPWTEPEMVQKAKERAAAKDTVAQKSTRKKGAKTAAKERAENVIV